MLSRLANIFRQSPSNSSSEDSLTSPSAGQPRDEPMVLQRRQSVLIEIPSEQAEPTLSPNRSRAVAARFSRYSSKATTAEKVAAQVSRAARRREEIIAARRAKLHMENEKVRYILMKCTSEAQLARFNSKSKLDSGMSRAAERRRQVLENRLTGAFAHNLGVVRRGRHARRLSQIAPAELQKKIEQQAQKAATLRAERQLARTRSAHETNEKASRLLAAARSAI
jgi:hypothetical protein